MKSRFSTRLGAAFAAGAAVLTFAGAAGAVTVTTQEPNFDEMLHNNGGANSASMQMFSKPGFYLMDVTSSETLAEAGGGQGHAWLSAADGALSDIKFAPSLTPALGYNLFDSFDAFGVKVSLTGSIDVPNTSGKGPATKKVNFKSYTYDVMFTFTTGGPLTITLPGLYLDDLPNSGQTNFFPSGSEGAFTSIKFLNAVGYTDAGQQGTAYATTFANFKQPSFNVTPDGGIVPEPSSWALMIAGFGGVGALMRRRRSALA